MPKPATTRTTFGQPRLILSLAILAMIVLGLASRKIALPAVLGKYPGDTLWATMVLLIWAWFLPQAGKRFLACAALVTCWLVEFSQLYQAPWLNQIRASTLGHLVLGSHFHAWDLFAYLLGVVLGVAVLLLLERIWRGKTTV